ncbi:hypothetical protein [Bradyrhizobium elkanii]|uniref:hypothetical protein n=1 Tax=Bradyrhizobium elkanii TaxID=29448 RepID=UPI001AEB4BB8|nr:hypothetical protein [Bradyrhizobium elkanii]MBP2434154.1 hypothetical protein [Bradyrhizobium elkanii]WLA88930.1 hypothetical protein QNJ96_27990 [Bradyrhizobium elkanii]
MKNSMITTVCSRRLVVHEDVRIAIHEAGHAVCARVLGHAVGGVTVSIRTRSAASKACAGVPGMKRRSRKAAVLHSTFGMRSVQLCRKRARIVVRLQMFSAMFTPNATAGRAAERMLLDEAPVVPSLD